MAIGLASEGHQISVLTSCATSYEDWADVHPPGLTVEAGVSIHRVRVRAPRDNERFIPLHLRAVDSADLPLWPWAQKRWAQQMGPDLDKAEDVVQQIAATHDVVVIVGYHYSQTLRLTRTVAAFAPTVVIPTAHPEGAFHVGWVRQMFDHSDRVICLAPEEADLVERTYGAGFKTEVVPCPVEQTVHPSEEDIQTAMRSHRLDRGRYAVVVGRVDPAKGSDDAIRYSSAYAKAVDRNFKLVVVGPGIAGERGGRRSVVTTGFVEQDELNALVAGSGMLLQPSYMESFSLALIEGWMLKRPALVQERSRVLAGHVQRSGGGLAYGDYLSFETAVTAIMGSQSLAMKLGEAGHRYALDEFAWRKVADDFLDALARAVASGGKRLAMEAVPRCVQGGPS
ncbi:MAG TPA: glycosyltransferase family 4 protein [Microthrixaceae bacterium]|nr:glycosyltransferase family 4 protein [Microthrixaceae bacterium]